MKNVFVKMLFNEGKHESWYQQCGKLEIPQIIFELLVFKQFE